MQEYLHLCILTTQNMLETFSSSVFFTTRGTIKHNGASTYLDSAVSSLFMMMMMLMMMIMMDQHKHAESKELNKARSNKRSRSCLKCPNTLF